MSLDVEWMAMNNFLIKKERTSFFIYILLLVLIFLQKKILHILHF